MLGERYGLGELSRRHKPKPGPGQAGHAVGRITERRAPARVASQETDGSQRRLDTERRCVRCSPNGLPSVLRASTSRALVTPSRAPGRADAQGRKPAEAPEMLFVLHRRG